MDPAITDQIFDEVFPVFQRLETQSAAILQFLKDKGIASDDELAPYLEEAGKSAGVRWQVTRIRVAKLLASAEKQAKQDTASVAEKVAKEAADKIAVEPAGKTGEQNDRETNPDSADNKDAENKGAENKPAETEAAKNNEATDDGRRAADGNSKTERNPATKPESTHQEDIRRKAVSEDRPQRDQPVLKTSRAEVPKDASGEHEGPGTKAAAKSKVKIEAKSEPRSA